MHPSHTYYFNGVFSAREKSIAIEKAISVLQDIDFEVIAVRGVSGLMVGSVLAHQMGKELAIVRKPSEGCHSGHEIEGFVGSYKYIIVDDLIATGETIRKIVSGVQEISPRAKCVGIYLYRDVSNYRYDPDGDSSRSTGMVVGDEALPYLNNQFSS